MTATLQLRLPDGREIPIRYPSSPLMDAVVREVFSGAEYPRLDFIAAAGSAIVDLGANVGCSAIVFAVKYPEAVVYALEPAKDAFAFLVDNTAPFPNIRNFQIGAFDRDASARLFHGCGGSVTNSLFSGGLAADTPGETVQLRRISSFLREQNVSRIAVLKIDTEGAELPILRDLAGHFPQVDAIHVEFHSEADRDGHRTSPRPALCALPRPDQRSESRDSHLCRAAAGWPRIRRALAGNQDANASRVKPLSTDAVRPFAMK